MSRDVFKGDRYVIHESSAGEDGLCVSIHWNEFDERHFRNLVIPNNRGAVYSEVEETAPVVSLVMANRLVELLKSVVSNVYGPNQWLRDEVAPLLRECGVTEKELVPFYLEDEEFWRAAVKFMDYNGMCVARTKGCTHRGRPEYHQSAEPRLSRCPLCKETY